VHLGGRFEALDDDGCGLGALDGPRGADEERREVGGVGLGGAAVLGEERVEGGALRFAEAGAVGFGDGGGEGDEAEPGVAGGRGGALEDRAEGALGEAGGGLGGGLEDVGAAEVLDEVVDGLVGGHGGDRPVDELAGIGAVAARRVGGPEEEGQGVGPGRVEQTGEGAGVHLVVDEHADAGGVELRRGAEGLDDDGVGPAVAAKPGVLGHGLVDPGGLIGQEDRGVDPLQRSVADCGDGGDHLGIGVIGEIGEQGPDRGEAVLLILVDVHAHVVEVVVDDDAVVVAVAVARGHVVEREALDGGGHGEGEAVETGPGVEFRSQPGRVRPDVLVAHEGGDDGGALRVGFAGEERLGGADVGDVLGAFEREADLGGAARDLLPQFHRGLGVELDRLAGPAAAARQQPGPPSGGKLELVFLGCNVFSHARPSGATGSSSPRVWPRCDTAFVEQRTVT
jgi:hypothetical protein